MLKDTILFLRKVPISFIPILSFFPEEDLAILEKQIINPLKQMHPEFLEKFHIIPQIGNDLAERFSNAFAFAFDELKLDSAIIIGSDTPHLQPTLITRSLNILLTKTKPAVLGPSQNGGFYLLGHIRPFISDIGMIFKRKTSYNELGNVMELLISNKYEVHILPEVTDVDTFDNLKTVRTIIKILSFTPSETKNYYFPSFTNNLLDLIDESIWISS
ncbi:MAG: TIGR04282 family arsenosugar biosynthesis glycosyltransferase [Candidatus Kariarchaeaceae archaeon]|jgi:glycosyltransferase A (GT-A) superfamily protein (DUF2064 family)